VRLVTVAPELPGALALIARLSERGIAVALGHSGASSEIAGAAVDAGARMVGHVFNAMAPLDHRAPGLAGVALVDRRVHVSVIADGVHLHPLALELVRLTAGRRIALISDSTPAAEAPTATYQMAGVPIQRANGAARTGDGRLAGTTLALDEAARNWGELTGATLAEALFAASEAPAAAALLPNPVGAGAPADLTLLDRAGVVRRVMRRGRWL
jgi:N-acetylglucosamine-6-phosphate deacetylase